MHHLPTVLRTVIALYIASLAIELRVDSTSPVLVRVDALLVNCLVTHATLALWVSIRMHWRVHL